MSIEAKHSACRSVSGQSRSGQSGSDQPVFRSFSQSLSESLVPSPTRADDAETESFVVEDIRLSSDMLMSQIHQLIEQGNVRRIVIKNEEGHALLRLPTATTVINSVIDAMLSSEVAAINVISTIVPNPSVMVEKFSR